MIKYTITMWEARNGEPMVKVEGDWVGEPGRDEMVWLERNEYRMLTTLQQVLWEGIKEYRRNVDNALQRFDGDEKSTRGLRLCRRELGKLEAAIFKPGKDLDWYIQKVWSVFRAGKREPLGYRREMDMRRRKAVKP